jgi:hypothetical protein
MIHGVDRMRPRIIRHRVVEASTIGRRVAAVRYVPKLAGPHTLTDHGRVKATVRGIGRTLGTANQEATSYRGAPACYGRRCWCRPQGRP